MTLQSSLNVVENVSYTYLILNNNLLHNYFIYYLLLRNVSASDLRNLQGALDTSMFRRRKQIVRTEHLKI